MRSNDSGDQLDALIDDTARAMTSSDAPASLRASIRARIDAQAARGWRLPIWQVATAAVALALIVVAMILRTPDSTTSLPPTVQADVRLEPMPSVTQIPAAPVPETGRPATVVAGTGKRAPFELPAPEPIVIEPIALDPIAAPVTTVESIPQPMPLGVDTLAVEPLTLE